MAKRKPDNIERIVIDMVKQGYGADYGRYIADHPHANDNATLAPDPEMPKEKTAVCRFCGKEYVRHHGSQRYCSDGCYAQAASQRQKEAYQRKMGAMGKLLCGGCGKYFEPVHRGQKYCCRYCAGRAKRKREKLKHEEAENFAKAMAE